MVGAGGEQDRDPGITDVYPAQAALQCAEPGGAPPSSRLGTGAP